MKTSTSRFISFGLPAVALIFALSGCFNLGGSGTAATKTVDDKTKIYETDEFSITLPKTWEVIEKKDFTSDVPSETSVVFRNNVKNESFTANVVIVKNNLLDPVITLDYAKMVNNRQESGLFNFKESRKEDIKISVGGNEEATLFVLFEAKKAAEEKLVRYLQTYGVKGKSAFIVTGAVSPQDNDSVVKNIEEIVKSFKLK